LKNGIIIIIIIMGHMLLLIIESFKKCEPFTFIYFKMSSSVNELCEKRKQGPPSREAYKQWGGAERERERESCQ